jgi:hypothetical protein
MTRPEKGDLTFHSRPICLECLACLACLNCLSIKITIHIFLLWADKEDLKANFLSADLLPLPTEMGNTGGEHESDNSSTHCHVGVVLMVRFPKSVNEIAPHQHGVSTLPATRMK